MQAWVYILECADKTLYTGYTTDIERRLSEHNTGDKKCKYTSAKSRRPVILRALWSVQEPKNNAMKLEYFIKSLNRATKLKLIENPSYISVLYEDKKGKLNFKIDADIKGDLCDRKQ